MPDLGPMEILLILVVLIVVFGVGKLPEIGRGIGKTIREFNKARAGEDETINTRMLLAQAKLRLEARASSPNPRAYLLLRPQHSR